MMSCPPSITSIFNDASCSHQPYTPNIGETLKSEISLTQDSNLYPDMDKIANQDLANKINFSDTAICIISGMDMT
jgi:hypothetical protein